MAKILIAFIAILAVSVSASDLPEFLHVCHISNPDFNGCVTESVMHFRPYLVKGVPEYNIPSLEPLLLKQVVAADGHGGLRLTGNDIKAYGSSDFTVERMKANMDNLIVNFDVILPHLYIVGQYDIDGKVLLLPIKGNGAITGNITGVVAAVEFRMTTHPNDAGVKMVDVEYLTLKVTVSGGKIRLDNLFGGDGPIGDVVNNAINSNFDAFLRELLPIIEVALGHSFHDIANGILKLFAYDQLFPQ